MQTTMKRDQCEECGEGEFELIDGVYYCCFCSAVNTKVREVEAAEDSAFFQVSVRGTLKAKAPKKDEEVKESDEHKEQKKRGRKKRDEEIVDSDNEIGDRSVRGVDFPPCLETVGYRLTTFTKLVTQIAYLLKEHYQVPAEVMDASYFILQEYFRRFGVAFFDGETWQEGQEQAPFLVRKKKTVKEIAKEEKDSQLKVEEARKRMVEERLSQLPPWERTLNAEQVKREVDEIYIPGESLQVLKTESTLLKAKTIDSAGFVYVGIDMALCIVYSAVLLCGCKWIQLSELFRWYREGRFFVTVSQLQALHFSVKYNSVKAILPHPARQFGSPPFYAILSGAEQLRVLNFLAQFTGIPPVMKSMPFPTVCSRLVYNLNLPTALLRQLKVLMDLLPPVHAELGADYFASLVPLSKDFQERVLHYKKMGFATFFRGCFGDTNKGWRGLQRRTQFFYWQIPTPEVKAAALLLLALKLVFGLDDSREHRMEEVDGEHDEEMFSFARWLTQLRLRTYARRGRSVEAVLSKTFSADAMEGGPGANQRDAYSGRYKHTYRIYPFDCCTPNRLMNCREKSHFEGLFPVDATNKPFDMSRDSLFAPLRHEASFRDKLGELLLDATIDREMAQLFFTTFASHHVDFKEAGVDRNTKSKFIARGGGNPAGEIETEQTPHFRELFPSSPGYLRFPCPSVQCLRVDTGPDGDEEKEADRWVISMPQIIFILSASRHYFSATFSALLKYVALAIDETEELLYFTFLLIEAGLISPEDADTAARQQEETASNAAGGDDNDEDSDDDEALADEKMATADENTADEAVRESSVDDELAEELEALEREAAQAEAEEAMPTRPFKVMRIPSPRALATLFDRYW